MTAVDTRAILQSKQWIQRIVVGTIGVEMAASLSKCSRARSRMHEPALALDPGAAFARLAAEAVLGNRDLVVSTFWAYTVRLLFTVVILGGVAGRRLG